MSRRIDIELTSALGDGTWTWRAAGARKPKGVVDGSVLPDGVKVGDELKVEVEQEIDGITVLGVVQGRQKSAPDVIELLPTDRDFQPVVETRAKRDRNDRGGRGRDRDRRPRRDRDDRGGDRGKRGEDRSDRRSRDGGGRNGGRGDGRRRDRDHDRRGPSFTPPPEVPQRPKPKRLRPGKAHRGAVLAELPEEQRAIAELALQGMGAVRQRVREENEKAAAEGRPPMPEASVMKIAEELLPKLRVAEWLDRAEAARRQMEHLDLRDLRSVVAAAGDPIVARDEEASALVAELQDALVRKQEQELLLWFGDVDAALAVGRVIRALRLSSQPPKAGVPFPVDIAHRLADSVNASLAPMDSPERWAAMLEAAAFSPVRSLIKPIRKPDVVNAELLATVKRLAPALPQIAELFEVEVDDTAPMPKPLRPNARQRKDGQSGTHDANRKGSDRKGGKGRKQKQPPPPPTTSPESPTRQDTATPQPEATEAPAATPPPATPQPEATEAPAATPPPATPQPEATEAPAATPPPATPQPEATEAPAATPPPATPQPEATATPAATPPPATPQPEATATPAATPQPEATATPPPATPQPEATATPAATPPPATPQPEATDVATDEDPPG